MPLGLRHVISGILAGGIPGFRMVFCCFTRPLVWLGGLDVFPFVSAAIPWRDDFMLSPLALINPRTGTGHVVACLVCCVFLLFVFCLLGFLLLVFVLVCLW